MTYLFRKRREFFVHVVLRAAIEQSYVRVDRNWIIVLSTM
jgi:hypothetical protein